MEYAEREKLRLEILVKTQEETIKEMEQHIELKEARIEKLENELTGYKLSNQSLSNALVKEIKKQRC